MASRTDAAHPGAPGGPTQPLSSSPTTKAPDVMEPYDEAYFRARYNPDAPPNAYAVTVAKALCGRYHPKRALDVGCGVGILLRAFAAHTDAWGIEGSAAAISISPARDHMRQVDLTKDAFPFPDAHFDMVTCVEVAEHIPEARLWVAEISRVLRPGGIFYLQTPNPWSMAAKADPTHINVRDKWHWIRAFRRYGLRPLHRELAAIDRELPVGHYGSKLPQWVRYGILEWPVVLTGTRTLFRKA
ncbi:MAG: class I SAM-dependent methyltransferase [Thermoplasmatota archaeon]